MAMFTGLTQIDATYLKSIDPFNNPVQTKIWGTLNKNSSLENVDAATRALCSLSKNTYNDTILQAIINYNNNDNEEPVGTNSKLEIKATSNGVTPVRDITRTVWSGSLNPEKSINDIQDAIGICSYSTLTSENKLFYLIDPDKYEIELQSTTVNYFGKSTAEISVNEYLTE